jgi:hypothetical protein
MWTLQGVVDVTLDPSNPNTIFAATYTRKEGIYGFTVIGGTLDLDYTKSTDGGKT